MIYDDLSYNSTFASRVVQLVRSIWFSSVFEHLDAFVSYVLNIFAYLLRWYGDVLRNDGDDRVICVCVTLEVE